MYLIFWFSEALYALFASYVNNSQQKFEVLMKPVCVHQSPKLGPLPFLLFIND